MKVAVLKGGRSLERQVSLRSGAQIEDALQRLGHETAVIDVGPELVKQVRVAKPDVAFIALHGRDGEDGAVQELLGAIGVPYTGSGPSACIRCADKVLAKHLLRDAGIPTPEFHSFNETAFRELGAAAALKDIERNLGFPLVVKPAGQGSALGIKFARSSEEVPGALLAAFSYDRKVLLERYVRGRDELDYDAALSAAGLRLDASSDSTAKVASQEYIGAVLAQEGDRLMVRNVIAGSAAYEQGLNAGDQIVAFDNARASLDFVLARLSEKRAGDLVRLTIFRFDDLRLLEVKLGARNLAHYRIIAVAQPTEQQKQIYQGWLRAPLGK